MAKIRFLFRNVLDIATASATPALLTGYDADRLQTQARTKSSVTTSVAAQTWQFSWVLPQTIDMFYMRRHNLTAAAQLALPTYSDSVFTAAIATNAAADCFNFTGLDANDVLTEFDFRLMKNSARFLTSSALVKSMKAVVTDAGNPDGRFEISRMGAGKMFEMYYQLPPGGAPLGQQDASNQYRMDDGSLSTHKKFKFRTLHLSADACRPEDWAALLAAKRYCGKDKDIFVTVFPDSGDYTTVYWQGLFKFTEMDDLSRMGYNMAQTKLTLAET